MFYTLGRVPGINQDVIELNSDITIKQVTEYVIHKLLEHRQGIRKTMIMYTVHTRSQRWSFIPPLTSYGPGCRPVQI